MLGTNWDEGVMSEGVLSGGGYVLDSLVGVTKVVMKKLKNLETLHINQHVVSIDIWFLGALGLHAMILLPSC